MTGVGLSEAERALLVTAFRSSSRSPEHLAFLVEPVVAQIVAARLAPMIEERDEERHHRMLTEAALETAQAEVADLKSQQPFRVAEANRLRAEAAEARADKAEALVEAGLGLIRAEADRYDHPNQWVARDLLHSVANRIAALGGAK